MSADGIVNPLASPSESTLHLQQAFKLALSMVLLYWLALWLNWDMPKYGALAIALISLDTNGASLQKGVMRIIGTTVGLAVGLLGLALFAQDSWFTLAYLTTYLIVIGYFMPTSRYPYAWYVAGFLPTLVWATTYGKVDNAFHYATFRYLETSAGIVIYTLVCVIFWPRQAGDKLNRLGLDLWRETQDLFDLYLRQLKGGQLPPDAAARRFKLAGTTSQILATLQAAYADTPSVARQKRAWEIFRVDVRALGDAMELWRQSIDDCRRLDVGRSLPQLQSALEKLGRRLVRIDDLWQIRAAGVKVGDTNDGDDKLLEPLQLDVARSPGADLSHLDRAALSSFAQQLGVLDLTSRELLRTMRVLAGAAPIQEIDSPSLPGDVYQPSRWDSVRLINGLLPAVCFAIAFFFWIHFDPPTGPSVPNMAATFGLLAVLTPMNVLVLLPLLLVAMWGFVAPVYFLVLPQLSTGPELLTLIFGFVFAVSTLLVGRLAPLKSAVLVLFAMMTGISNQQSYSFMGLVDAALMMILAIGIIAIVQMLFSPYRPEQTILKSVHRFFYGCARVTSGLALSDPGTQTKARRIRKRYFESMVLPAPAKIQAARKHLDFKLHPENSPEKVQLLIDSLQEIVYRLQALEIAYRRISLGSSEVAKFATLGKQVQEALRRVFESWASFIPGDGFESQRDQLQLLSHDLKRQFDNLESGPAQNEENEPIVTDLYTMLGSVRGLIEAMAGTQGIIGTINWRQWATVRF